MITITLPEEMANALQVSADNVGDEVRMLAAVKLFEMGRMSSGAAANLAGIPRIEFLHRLSAYGVSAFDTTEEELRNEANLA